MRTEDDLRGALHLDTDHEALTRLTAFALQLDDAVSDKPAGRAAGDRRARRAPLSLVGAVAAVALLALGVAWLVTPGPANQTGSDHGPARGQHRPVWNVRVAAVPGYLATRVNASSMGRANGSTITIRSVNADRPEQGVITTCPGSFDTCAQGTSTPDAAAVHGRPGVFTPGRPVQRPSRPHSTRLSDAWVAAAKADVGPSLAWYAGHDTTVFLSGTFGFDPRTFAYDNHAAETILLRIAAATTAGHRDATHLPFTLTGLPAGVAAETVRLGQGGACGGYGVGPRSVDDALGIVFTACRVTTGRTSSLTVARAAQADSNPTNGAGVFPPARSVVVDHRDGTSVVLAVETGQDRVSLDRARELAEQADVSPRLDDPTTWATVP